MPRVTVPAGELNAIDLPAICVVTGQTENVRFFPVSYRSASWGWLLVLLPLVFIFRAMELALVLAPIVMGIALILGPRVRGELPFVPEGRDAARRADVFRLVGSAAMVCGTVMLILVELAGAAPHGFPLGPLMALAVAVVLAGGCASVTLGRSSRVHLVSLGKRRLVLAIPSVAAQRAFNLRLESWSADDREPWSTRRASEPRPCAVHAGAPASWICGRCGSFACDACLQRVRPGAMPLCAGCFARRPSATA